MTDEKIVIEPAETKPETTEPTSGPVVHDPRREAIERISAKRAEEFSQADEPEPSLEAADDTDTDDATVDDKETDTDDAVAIDEESEALKALDEEPEPPNEIEQLKAQIAALESRLPTPATPEPEEQAPAFDADAWLEKILAAEEDGDIDAKVALEKERWDYQQQALDQKIQAVREEERKVAQEREYRMTAVQFADRYPDIINNEKLVAAADRRVAELTAKGHDYYTAAMTAGREIHGLITKKASSTDARPNRQNRQQVKRETVIRTPSGAAVPKKEGDRVPTQSEAIQMMREQRAVRRPPR